MVLSALLITESSATGSCSASKGDRENGQKRLFHSIPQTSHACQSCWWERGNRQTVAPVTSKVPPFNNVPHCTSCGQV